MAQYDKNSKESMRNYPDSRHLNGELKHSDGRHNSLYDENDDLHKYKPESKTEKNSLESRNEYSSSENHEDSSLTGTNERQSLHNSNHERYSNGKKKRSNLIFIIIIIVAACVLIFAVYKLISINSGYKEAADTYEAIAEIFEPVTEKATVNSTETIEETTTVNPFNWDYDALLNINWESVGWIRDGNIINYPIVHSTAEDGNSRYLYSLIDGTYNTCGTLFVDKNIPTGLEGNYSIVYGHNMNDHSMFGSLLGYQDSSYYESNPEMDVYIGYTHYVYKVFAAFTTTTESFVYTYSLDDGYTFNNFVETARSCNSYAMYGGSIDFGTNNIITLSTCTGADGSNYRYVVMLCRDHIVND